MIALRTSSVAYPWTVHAARYLIIVISKHFPVEVANDVPLVVKVVVVHVEIPQPGLHIERSKVILPCRIRFRLRIEVHPDITKAVDMCTDAEETI